MCGIVGFMGPNSVGSLCGDEELLRKMTDTIIHRGPNDAGYWNHIDQRIGLGHRRLSIVDLTSAGHQPMHSKSGRYIIVFNGEIYNHKSLRIELCDPSINWRGHSDTETLLAGFDKWGIKGTIERALGMFAFAVWDRQENVLTLGRDRLGEKPLYYGWQGCGTQAVFLFGSELKALKAHPVFQRNINRGALSLLLRHSYIPAPYSIYDGIFKLMPGSLLTVSLEKPAPEVSVYWSGVQVAESGSSKIMLSNDQQTVDKFEILLKDAVHQQMMADVPLGAFLSGGIDSSTIVALMQANSSRPVKTFTIGFNEEAYNEAAQAKALARHFGTEHTELYITSDHARSVIPLLPTLYDEPFSDSSQIPTFLISKLARQHVAVALSGDGGDELFCGYNRYKIAQNIWPYLSVMPLPVRKLIASGLTGISPDSWNSLVGLLGRFNRLPGAGDKLHKGAGVLSSQSVDDLYLALVSQWNEPESVVINGREPPTFLTSNAPMLKGLDEVQRMMVKDMITYLPDDILTKVDRAAMGVSLETRVPFLDHRVVEFAWSLPPSMRLRNGQTKWILRQVLYRYAPKSLVERPKMGFGVPIGAWLRGPLREWAEALLSESKLRREGYFHPHIIRRKWTEHLSGSRNWQSQLWTVLMFQAWLENE